MIHVEDATKDEILLKTFISQEDPQAVNGNTETDGKEFDDNKTLLTLPYDI